MKQIVQKLIIFALICTPLLNIFELFAIIQNNYSDRGLVLTPFYIKSIKDLFFISIIVIGVFSVVREKKIFVSKSYLIFVSLAVLSILFTFLGNYTLQMMLAGIRWIIPFVAIPFIYRFVDDKLQSDISKTILILFFISFLFQIFELYFFKNALYGKNALGLSLRNPGFFLIPPTMACFTIVSMYYVSYYSKKKYLKNFMIYFAGPISVFLTGSGTGVISLFVFFFVKIYYKIRQKYVLVVTIVPMIIILFLTIPTIVGRENLYISPLTRMSMFFENVTWRDAIISGRFGFGTNTYLAFVTSFDKYQNKGISVDSTFNSILINVGFVSLFVFLTFYLRNFKFESKYLHFLFIIGIFMITSVLFETFPINLLFAINFVHFQKNKYSNFRA